MFGTGETLPARIGALLLAGGAAPRIAGPTSPSDDYHV
jgi:hypothetical protein